MVSNGLIPVSAFQRTAHFSLQDNDIFYVSSNCVKLSKNQLQRLKEELIGKITELDGHLRKVSSENEEHRQLFKIQSDTANYFRNQLKTLFNDYVRAMKINSYSPYTDYKNIDLRQEKKNKKLIGRFNDLLENDDIELQYTGIKTVGELEQIINETKYELNILRDYLKQLFFILDNFYKNNECRQIFENRIRTFIREINRCKIFKKYFFDFFINIKSNELQLTKKVIVDQVKKAVGKYKKIMKLRKQNFSVYKYWDLIQLMEDNQNEIDGLYKDYIEMVKNIKEEVKKYKTGYFVNYKDGYRIRPFYENQHKKEMDKISELFYGDDFADIEELKEMKRYADYFNIPDADQFYKSRHLTSKYHNASLLIRIAKKEKQELDELTKEVDPDDIHFLDEDEVEETEEVEEDEYYEEKQQIKNKVVEQINEIFEKYELDDPDYNIGYINKSDEETILFMELESVSHTITFKLDFQDRYYLHIFVENETIDNLINEIENEL